MLSFTSPFLLTFVSGYGLFDLTHQPSSDARIDYVSRTKAGETPFFHPLFHILLGHRSSPFTFSIAALLLLFLSRPSKFARSDSRAPLSLIGALLGLLPSLHIHAFVGFTILTLFHLAFHPRPSASFFLASLLCSSAVHLPRLFPLIRGISLRPLWQPCVLSGGLFCSVRFWFSWLGLFPPAALLLPLSVARRQELPLILATIATAVLSSRLSLGAPARFDPFTLHFSALPPACVFLLVLLHRVATHARMPPELRGFIAAAIFAIAALGVGSALASAWERLPHAEPAFGADERAVADWIRANAPRAAVFACAGGDRGLSPAALAGRVSFAADPGIAAELGIASRGSLVKKWCSDRAAVWEGVDFFIERVDAKKTCQLGEGWANAGHVGNYTFYRRVA